MRQCKIGVFGISTMTSFMANLDGCEDHEANEQNRDTREIQEKYKNPDSNPENPTITCPEELWKQFQEMKSKIEEIRNSSIKISDEQLIKLESLKFLENIITNKLCKLDIAEDYTFLVKLFLSEFSNYDE